MEQTGKEVSVLDVGGKPQRISPGENPDDQVGAENPSTSASVWFNHGPRGVRRGKIPLY